MYNKVQIRPNIGHITLHIKIMFALFATGDLLLPVTVQLYAIDGIAFSMLVRSTTWMRSDLLKQFQSAHWASETNYRHESYLPTS